MLLVLYIQLKSGLDSYSYQYLQDSRKFLLSSLHQQVAHSFEVEVAHIQDKYELSTIYQNGRENQKQTKKENTVFFFDQQSKRNPMPYHFK